MGMFLLTIDTTEVCFVYSIGFVDCVCVCVCRRKIHPKEYCSVLYKSISHINCHGCCDDLVVYCSQGDSLFELQT